MNNLTKATIITLLVFLISHPQPLSAIDDGYYSSELVEGLDLYWTRDYSYDTGGPKTPILLQNYYINIKQNMSGFLITNDTIANYLDMYMNGTPYTPQQINLQLWDFILPTQIKIDDSTYSIKAYFEFIFSSHANVSVNQENGNVVVLYSYSTINTLVIVDIIVDASSGIVELFQTYTREVAGTVIVYFTDKYVFTGGLDVSETSGLGLELWVSIPILIVMGYFLKRKKSKDNN